MSLPFSCSKKDILTPADIKGTWELRAYYNGWTGKTEPVTDSTRLVVFSESSYQNFTNGMLRKTGTYKITRDKSVVNGETGDRIIYDDNKDDFRTFITLFHDSLTFSIDAYDAGGSLYVKR